MVFEILGLVFSIIIGTIGHFLYDWSNHNSVVGFLFSRDESTWEHIKLGITPIILWSIIEFVFFDFTNLFIAKFISIIVFVFSIIVLYYGYKHIIKKNILFLDILIFYLSLFFAYLVSILIVKNLNYYFIVNIIGIIGLLFIGFLYYKFDKYSSNCFLFRN